MGKYSRNQWSIMGKQKVRNMRKLRRIPTRSLFSKSRYYFNSGQPGLGKLYWKVGKSKVYYAKRKSSAFRSVFG